MVNLGPVDGKSGAGHKVALLNAERATFQMEDIANNLFLIATAATPTCDVEIYYTRI